MSTTNWGHDAVLALRQVAAESYLLQSGTTVSGELLLARLVHGANPPGVERGNTLRMTARQAEWFVRTTEVVAQYESDNSGLSATLMRDRASGRWQIALRGTEFLSLAEGGDWERDGIAGADGQLARYGVALLQLDHLRRLFDDWRARYGFGEEDITVTGYSLGAHLAVGLVELYPELVAEAVGFNGPTRGSWGLDGATLMEILDFHRGVTLAPGLGLELLADDPRLPELLAGSRAGEDPVLLTNAYNDLRTAIAAAATAHVYQLSGLALGNFEGDALPAAVQSRFRLVVGQAAHGDRLLISARGVEAPLQRVLIEDQPDVAGLGGFLDGIGSFGHTHSLVLLIDALLVHDFIARMAPGLAFFVIPDLLQAASLQRAEGFIGFTDQAHVEGDTLERAVDAWRRLFLGDDIGLLPWRSGLTGYGDLDARSSLHAAMEELLQRPEAAAGIRVTPLIGSHGTWLGPAELAARAADSPALRYALWSLTPFTVEDESSLLSAPGRSERLQALDAVHLSLRARFASEYWARALSISGPDASGLPPLDFRYQDVTAGIDLFDDEDASRVVFGSIRSDVIAGSEGRDWLFGDDGADRLLGAGGADRLVGGLGDDRLDGGAEADILEGGAGFDVYLAGDGDTVRDVDGKGRIRFSGDWLDVGFASGAPGVWRAWNADVEYRLEGEQLLVRRLLPGSFGLFGPVWQSLVIEGWSQGDLGIRLLDVPPPYRSWFADAGSQRIDVYDDGQRFVLGATPGDPQALQRFTLERASSVRTLLFGAAPDQLFLDRGNQVVVLHDPPPSSMWIRTGAGEDVVSALVGGGPEALLRAELGSGHDRFSGSSSGDFAAGGTGDDLLRGNGGDDVLLGDAGADLIAGDAGADRLAGGSGDDWLVGGAGADILEGGAGGDHLYGDAQARALAWMGGEMLPLTDIFYRPATAGRLAGSFAFLVEMADGGADWLVGGAGNDNLFGGAGDDHLEGGDDADLLQGESGDDWLEGGAGNDILIGDEGAEQRAAEERLIEGVAGVGFGGVAVAFHLRDAGPLTAGNDRLDGGAGNDVLRGGAGDDTYLFAHTGGEDVLIDSAGFDRLLLEGYSDEWFFSPDFTLPGSSALLVISRVAWGFQQWNIARLTGWFDVNPTSRIESIGFADGETWLEADVRAAIPDRELLSPGLRWTAGRGGSYYSLAELLVRDAVYRVQGWQGLDVVDLRAASIDPAESGVSSTALDHLRREGMDLVVDVVVERGPEPLPPLVLHGAASPDSAAAAGGWAASAASRAGQVSFTLVLEDWFLPEHRVEAIVLDDGIIGLPGTPPVPGSAALAPFVNPGAELAWQVPGDAFLDAPADLLSFALATSAGGELPAWLTFDTATATLRARPGASERGLFAFTLHATDLSGMSASRPLVLNVGMPVAPTFTRLPEALTIALAGPGTLLDVPWRIEDVNAGDTLAIDIRDALGRAVGWAGLRADGLFLRPGLRDTGIHDLVVRARDGAGLEAVAALRVEVLPLGAAGPTDGRAAGDGGVLIGTAGADVLRGSAGDDLIHAGAGDDSIVAGGGRDRIYLAPGDGIDTLSVQEGGAVTIELPLGLDPSRVSVHLAGSADVQLGIRFEDGLGLNLPGLFERETRSIDGELHQLDVLRVGNIPALTLRYAEDPGLRSLTDLLLGAGPVRPAPEWYARPASVAALAWSDSLTDRRSSPASAGVRLLAGAGSERLQGSHLADRLYGGAGADHLAGLAGDDRLYGEEGDDLLVAGEGADWLSGGAGDDTLLGGAGDDAYVIAAGGGHDSIDDRSGRNALWLVGGADVTGFGIRGQDVRLVFADGASVTLAGGLDARTIAIVHRAETPSAEPTLSLGFHDFLRGIGWQDAAPASRADIFHLRLPAGQALTGFSLARLFTAADGDPLRFGLQVLEGPGSDAGWLDLDGHSGLLGGTAGPSDAGLWQWRAEATDPNGQSATTVLAVLVDDGVSRFGSAQDDRLRAGVDGSTLHGLAGDDWLAGDAGADALHGGSGTDHLEGGEGDDFLYWSADRMASAFDRIVPGSGAGNRSLALEGRWLSEDVLIGGAGEDILIGTEGSDAVRLRDIDGSLLLDGIEVLFLRGGDDIVDLTEASAALEVDGGAGDDILWGGTGNDDLDGGPGDDWLVGGAGDDYLSAGTGRDSLDGGTGNDRYSIEAGAQVLIRDEAGVDGLLWLTEAPGGSFALRRSGEALHLRDDADTRLEIAGWFARGAGLPIEVLATPDRWLDLRELGPLLPANGSPGGGADAAWVDIPDGLWRPVPQGADPLAGLLGVA